MQLTLLHGELPNQVNQIGTQISSYKEKKGGGEVSLHGNIWS